MSRVPDQMLKELPGQNFQEVFENSKLLHM